KEWVLAVMVLPVVFSNLFIGFHKDLFLPSLQRFRWTIIALGVGIAAGVVGFAWLPPDAFLLIVGVVVMTFATLDQLRLVWPVPDRRAQAVGVGAGLLGGVLGGISTAFGPPLVMYFTALRLPKEQFVAAIGVVWTFGSVFLLIALHSASVLTAERLAASLAACVPVGVGLWFGVRMRDRIPQEPFRRVIGVALLLLGANLVRRALL
ncbi:MAG: sulfite exporter TauE/SafE family protein, partial [Gammaproteobacteria bacterium]|nr:sulfite exporter TauE/SafE family protein [Gammaproteobacteria bacterium]